MREIKFRGFDYIDKKIREVTNINFYDDLVYLDEKADGSCIKRKLSEVEPLQYTGLKDKNGKEIYEGDIVRLMGYKNSPVKFSIVYNKSSFIMKRIGKGDDYDLDFEIYNTEVIGNIYENKDLLGENK